MVNCDSKELPPGMQQVLDNHYRIVQMISQIRASTSKNLPQSDHDVKKPRDGAEIMLQACKIYGEIGHMSKGCREQCPDCYRWRGDDGVNDRPVGKAQEEGMMNIAASYSLSKKPRFVSLGKSQYS
jgi:hypothetical protein